MYKRQTNGYADATPVDRMRAWETALLRYMDNSHPELGKDIAEKKQISEVTGMKLRAALDTFKATWQ